MIKHPEVIVTNLKKRHSGVSSTIFSLLPHQQKFHIIRYLGSSLFHQLSLWHAIKCSLTAPKILWHVRRDHEMVLALLVRFFSKRRVKIIFTSAAQRYHGRFVRWLMSKMDAIVAVSQKAALYCPRVDAIINHGVDCKKFEMAEKVSKNPDIIEIGIFGRIRAEKGIDIFVASMIQVLHHFPNAHAFMIGECLKEDILFKQKLVEKIEIAGLSHRFTWAGYVPYQEIYLWYQRLTIVVACPLYEGFGLTLFEAAASGCAIIGSKTGAFPDLIEDGKTGRLIKVGCVSSCTEALHDMLFDKNKTQKMAETAKEKVRREFSIENEAQALSHLYDKLLKSFP